MDTARVADSIILASRGPQIIVNHTIFKIQNKILPKRETDISYLPSFCSSYYYCTKVNQKSIPFDNITEAVSAMTALQASTSYGVGFAVSSFPAPPRTSPNRRLILASGTSPVHFSLLTVIPPLPILLEVHFSSELLRRIV